MTEYELREQDKWLPIANVSRIMKNALPPNAKISKEAKECMQECVSEFVSFITSEASEKCSTERRKTLNGEDVLFAMLSLGFENYAEVLKIYLAKYREAQALKQETAYRNRTKKRAEKSQRSTEEDQQQQSDSRELSLERLDDMMTEKYSEQELQEIQQQQQEQGHTDLKFSTVADDAYYTVNDDNMERELRQATGSPYGNAINNNSIADDEGEFIDIKQEGGEENKNSNPIQDLVNGLMPGDLEGKYMNDDEYLSNQQQQQFQNPEFQTTDIY